MLTHHECGSASLTAIQTNAGNLSSQNQEDVCCEYSADLEEHPAQTVTHNTRRLRVETDMTRRCFTHFLVSVASRVRLERTQGHPATSGTWRFMTPFNVRVNGWRTLCSVECQKSEPQTDTCNIKIRGWTFTHTVSQTLQQTLDFFTADDSQHSVSGCFVRNNTAEFLVHCPLFPTRGSNPMIGVNSY